MKAIVLNNYGAPEDLHLQEVADPQPGADEVLVKIHAAGVNLLDVGKAMGAFKNQFQLNFPWIPGIEFSGVVVNTGNGYKAGDEVFGLSLQGGAFAEYIAIAPSLISPKPQSLNFIETASVPVAAQTAWQALSQQDLKGKTILIHGGAGAVGAYAVQLASQAGAKVIVTAKQSDVAYLQSLGADQIIDRAEPFEQQLSEIDIVLDLVGKDVQQRSFSVIKKGGYLITTNQPPSPELVAKFGINASFFQLQPSGAGLAELADMIDDGKLKISLATVYPLSEAVTSWNDLIGKGSKKNGRIVLEVK